MVSNDITGVASTTNSNHFGCSETIITYIIWNKNLAFTQIVNISAVECSTCVPLSDNVGANDTTYFSSIILIKQQS